MITERPLKITSYKYLDIWKLGKEIVKLIYHMTSKFPPRENFSLSQQMRKAAISIPSNVAEGFNRYHNKEYRQFLFIALGSCAELETQVEISLDLEYIDPETFKTINEKLNHETRMLRNLIKRL